MALSKKRQVFVEAYLQCWNATEAAKRAGYSEHTARAQGSRLLTDVYIAEEIKARLEAEAMSSDEVLQRLGQQARFNLGDYISGGFLDLEQLKADGFGHLLKGMRPTKEGVVYEFYDGQTALIQIGKHHKLFTDKHELTGEDGPVLVQVVGGIDPGKL